MPQSAAVAAVAAAAAVAVVVADNTYVDAAPAAPAACMGPSTATEETEPSSAVPYKGPLPTTEKVELGETPTERAVSRGRSDTGSEVPEQIDTPMRGPR